MILSWNLQVRNPYFFVAVGRISWVYCGMPNNQKVFSALPRGIDWNNASNRFVVLFALGGGVVVAIINLWLRSDPALTLLDSVLMSLYVFLTWAIAREIDPDHPSSANVASIMTFAVTCFLLPGLPVSILEMFVLLLVLRMVIRSTGPQVTFLDLTLILGSGLVVGVVNTDWILLVLLAVGFLLDFVLPDPQRMSFWPGICTLMMLGLVWAFMPMSVRPNYDWSLPIVVVLLLVMLSFVMWMFIPIKKLKFRTDLWQSPLIIERLGAGQILFAVFALMMTLHVGPELAVGFAGLWSIVVVIPVVYLWDFLHKVLTVER